MTRRPTRTLRTRRHVQCTLRLSCESYGAGTCALTITSEPKKEIPKVVTTCSNRHHAPSNTLIGLAPHHAKSQKPAPNCSSWVRSLSLHVESGLLAND